MIVADTNVIAYLYLPGAHTALAERLLERDGDWVAPVLWRSEMRSALVLYLRKSLISLDDAVRIQTEAEAQFRDREFEVTTPDVLALADRSRCSAYDCEFVALARAVGTALVTMDKSLVAAFPDTAVRLDDYVARI